MNKRLLFFAALAVLAVVIAAVFSLPTWAACLWIAAAAAGIMDLNTARGDK